MVFVSFLFQISMIVDWFTHQSELRKTKWRAQRLVLAREGREKSLEGSDQWGLEEEMKVSLFAICLPRRNSNRSI